MRTRRFFLSIVLLAVSMTAGCGDRRASFETPVNSGPPTPGGTLRIVGSSDVDHFSTTSAYGAVSFGLLWTFTRQLVTYPLSSDFEASTHVAADLAQALPTHENGGISVDDRTYTFHLRRDVRWNTSPVREVNAHDLERGIKMICNPVSPSAATGYYTTTIVGMKEYCDAFSKVPGTVADIRKFIETHLVEGARAVDDFTFVFRLVQPASDFLNILAMPFASPYPAEYLEYLPDDPQFRQHTISNLPYQIVKYIPNRQTQLERNSAWTSSSDPLRPAYVNRSSITLGIDQQLTQLQIEAGTADLSFGIVPPTSEIASLLEIRDPKLILAPPGDSFAGIFYLAVNLVGPNGGGPLGNPDVRKALELAINKAATVQVQGGPRVARPARQAIASSVTGYRPDADQFVTPMDKGDPAKARELLSGAGYADRLSLKLAYMQTNTYALIAQTVQESFRRAGIDVQLNSYTAADFYGRLLENPQNARRGVWDLALAGWYPDWLGGNNGRSVIQPLFDGRSFGPASMDYGGYNSLSVNAAIDRALAAPKLEDSEKAWAEAAGQIMKDMAIIPLYESKTARYHSARVRNCLLSLWSLNCDMTGVWLKDATSAEDKP